jgi:hypothetical protein
MTVGSLFGFVEKGYPKKQAGGEPSPYYGYYYRILKAQGKDAPGGAYDCMVKGRMIGGFAVVAYPAEYGDSGPCCRELTLQPSGRVEIPGGSTQKEH